MKNKLKNEWKIKLKEKNQEFTQAKIKLIKLKKAAMIIKKN